VLRSGHVEKDGKVVVVRPHASEGIPSRARMRAGRTVPMTGAGLVVSDAASMSTSTPSLTKLETPRR
jgi:hypothetical protein